MAPQHVRNAGREVVLFAGREPLRAALLCLTVLVGLLVLPDLAGPLRTPLAVAFALVAPGLAWARLLPLPDAGDRFAIGVALSAALLMLVGETMALLHGWSTVGGFTMLAVITVGGLAVPSPRRRRA